MLKKKIQSMQEVIVPSEAELSSSGALDCTQKGCKSRFLTASNLNMHLVKHHKLASLTKQFASYACPVRDCKRNEQAKVHFKSFKLLKQHYVKCHSAKTFKCHLCPKAFAKEYMQRAHTKSCGKIFLCSCGWEYTTREALLTHCKRKSHKPASDMGNTATLSQSQGKKADHDKLVQVCIRSKIPKVGNINEATAFPTHYVAAIALSELSSTTFIIPKHCHTSVQTAAAGDTDKTSHSRKSSQETQTGRKSKKSAETQTSKNYKTNERKRRRSTETQTKELTLPVVLDSKAKCDESLDLLDDTSDDVTLRKSPSLNDLSVWSNPHVDKPYSSSRQSHHHNEDGLACFDKLCNNETQTDLGDLFGAETEGMSSAETQTTDDLIEDLYSNMCTQTTDLFDFNWVDTSDNQTQTAWPDI